MDIGFSAVAAHEVGFDKKGSHAPVNSDAGDRPCWPTVAKRPDDRALVEDRADKIEHKRQTKVVLAKSAGSKVAWFVPRTTGQIEPLPWAG